MKPWWLGANCHSPFSRPFPFFNTLHTPLPIPQLKRKFRIEKGYSELGDGDFEAKMQFFYWLDSNLKIASLNQSQPRMACCCLSSVDDYDA